MKRYLIFGALGPFVGGLLMLFATTWLPATGPRPIGRRSGSSSWVRQDAAIRLSVRRRAGADARRRSTTSFITCGGFPGGAVLIVGAIGFIAVGTALRLARTGLRRDAVHPLRAGRLRAGGAVVVAGAQICRRADAGLRRRTATIWRTAAPGVFGDVSAETQRCVCEAGGIYLACPGSGVKPAHRQCAIAALERGGRHCGLTLTTSEFALSAPATNAKRLRKGCAASGAIHSHALRPDGCFAESSSGASFARPGWPQ